MFDFDIVRIVAGLPGLLIALVVHEYAHARAAVAMGDPTPAMMGRLTLNPKEHIDPVGLLALLLVQFGWAKPVVYNPRNFRNWRKGDIIVALAGPGANLAIGFIATFAYYLMYRLGMDMSVGVHSVMRLIIIFNVNFAIFNMLPIPPLDGSKVLMNILPGNLAYRFAQLEQYSFFILIGLMMTPILGMIIIPISRFVMDMYSLIILTIL